jgi:hypothetical protein
MTRLMRESASRMVALIDNLLDFARGRLGGGLTLSRDSNKPLKPVLREVIAEVQAGQPARIVETDFTLIEAINCDRCRIAQLSSKGQWAAAARPAAIFWAKARCGYRTSGPLPESAKKPVIFPILIAYNNDGEPNHDALPDPRGKTPVLSRLQPGFLPSRPALIL